MSFALHFEVIGVDDVDACGGVHGQIYRVALSIEGKKG